MVNGNYFYSTGFRIVTNSSAAVGWIPMVELNTALVASARIATAIPWMISLASAGHVYANYSAGTASDDHFHQRHFTKAGKRVLHRCKNRFIAINIFITVSRHGLD